MKDKYYTPELNEFHIGFEYEQHSDFDGSSELDWHKIMCDGQEFDNENTWLPGEEGWEDQIRVKYLDKDDIEDCGWKQLGEPWKYIIDDPIRKEAWHMSWYDNGVAIISLKLYNLFGEEIEIDYFRGTIKNKSELTRVLKMIGVES